MGAHGKASIIAVITTRWKSTRFPGKALALLDGKPITQHIIERLHEVPQIDQTVVVPSVNSQPIVDWCKEHNVDCLEHHLDHDYFGQLILAAFAYNPTYIVRVWGDCPLLNPELVTDALEYAWNYDLMTLKQVPNGWNVTIFKTEALRRASRTMTASDKYIFNEIDEMEFFCRNGFKVGIYFGEDLSLLDTKFSIDTPEDLQMLEQWLKSKK